MVTKQLPAHTQGDFLHEHKMTSCMCGRWLPSWTLQATREIAFPLLNPVNEKGWKKTLPQPQKKKFILAILSLPYTFKSPGNASLLKSVFLKQIIASKTGLPWFAKRNQNPLWEHGLRDVGIPEEKMGLWKTLGNRTKDGSITGSIIGGWLRTCLYFKLLAPAWRCTI